MLTMSSKSDQYNHYKTQNVLTASPGELTIMLYDGALKNLKLGKIHIESGLPEQVNSALQKAQDIIEELISTLDLQYELSSQMLSLYVFINEQVVAANIKKDASLLDAPISLLAEFREAWQQVVKQSRIMQAQGIGVPVNG